jgi:hypothetical protein
MNVIATGSGFALWFSDEEDLKTTIENLQSLKAERAAAPTKSWPAFLSFNVCEATVEKQTTYWKAMLRFLRSRLHKEDPAKFTD